MKNDTFEGSYLLLKLACMINKRNQATEDRFVPLIGGLARNLITKYTAHDIYTQTQRENLLLI